MRSLGAFFVFLALGLATEPANAYSVLTHEQVVDLLWKSQIDPMLRARFPNATQEELREAHAYAYGGSLIQDIGYYPFGNHFFSDLTHYVRSGDFVANMISDARQDNDLDEYAFALGALAHYASDIAGHPAVNLADASYFPKLRKRYGAVVTYADNPTDHIRTEFGFDVAQVAQDRFTSQSYHDFIGFEVSKPLLEKAFPQTYGLTLESVFPDLDLAIGTFRYAVGQLIPQLTRVAIATRRDEIAKADPEQNPSTLRRRFVYRLKASQYRTEWGRDYKGPSFGAKILAFFITILPKIGPLRALDVKMPTPYTEDLYMKSVILSAQHYGDHLLQARKPDFQLANVDFDTGKPTQEGEYTLADETYADLLNKLAADHFAHVTPDLKANILGYFADPRPPAFAVHHPQKWAATLADLGQLRAYQISAPPALAATP